MTRINLLGEKVDNSGLYLLQLLGFCSMLFLTTVTCFIVYQTSNSRLDSARDEVALLESQLVKLREKTKKVENLEKNKIVLREKLMTIAKLKAKKQGPVHVLNDLSLAIPERAWITAVNQKPESLEFKGIAQDPQTVSNFARSLESSQYFEGVEPQYVRQTIKEDVAVQEFSVLAKMRNPLDIKNLIKSDTADGKKDKNTKNQSSDKEEPKAKDKSV